MVQLQKRHKATYLKDEILKCLKAYDIELTQIYSSTTDNGANVVKVSKILQELQEDQICEEIDEESEIDGENTENIQKSLTSVLSVVRCAAHTIQLAAYDVLKVVEPQVVECRTVIKKIRSSVRAGGGEIHMPVLDNTTRWNSTYEMLKSLQSIKEYIETEYLESSDQIDINWNFVTEFLTAFTPVAICTKQLQSEQYVFGDFYRDWLSCEIELEDLVSTNTYASQLLQAMHKRKKLLLLNDAFVSALYLDPRFNFMNSVMLSDEDKNKALVRFEFNSIT